jgi:hypothetical protein
MNAKLYAHILSGHWPFIKGNIKAFENEIYSAVRKKINFLPHRE